MVFSAWMITGTLPEGDTIVSRITYLIKKSRKMFVLAAIYGAMNILSYVSLRNIGAGHLYNLCAVQDFDDGHLLVNHLETQVLLGPMESHGVSHARSPLIHSSSVEQFKRPGWRQCFYWYCCCFN
jgi:hypothetical protein